MDRLESGICVSVLKLSGSTIIFSIYGIAKGTSIDAIKENILHLAKEMTHSSSPNVKISVGLDREISLNAVTMEDLEKSSY